MNKNTALIFLGGAAVGATAALLFAPRSGKETRKAIRDGVDTAIDRTQQAIGNARQKTAMLPSAIADAGSAARVAFEERYAGGEMHD